MFPAFELPEEAKKHIKIYTRITFDKREKQCWFCEHCGSRILHWIEGQPMMTVKGCFNGLTKEMMDGAVHIWAKRAIVPIPEGAEVWQEEPDDGTGDKI